MFPEASSAVHVAWREGHLGVRACVCVVCVLRMPRRIWPLRKLCPSTHKRTQVFFF